MFFLIHLKLHGAWSMEHGAWSMEHGVRLQGHRVARLQGYKVTRLHFKNTNKKSKSET
jgi:hypothetical protein